MSAASNEQIARDWIAAFNRADLEGLIALYAEDATHTSPKIRALHPDTDGKLQGHAALRRWWTDAIARLPGLRYDLVSITSGEASVFIEYIREATGQAPMQVAEVFEIQAKKIVASRVYHG